MNQVQISLSCEPERTPLDHYVKSTKLADPDGFVSAVKEALAVSPWGWCTAKVTATLPDGRTGHDWLGACSHKGPLDFIRNSGYYADMVDNAVRAAQTQPPTTATDDLAEVIQAADDMLGQLGHTMTWTVVNEHVAGAHCQHCMAPARVDSDPPPTGLKYAGAAFDTACKNRFAGDTALTMFGVQVTIEHAAVVYIPPTHILPAVQFFAPEHRDTYPSFDITTTISEIKAATIDGAVPDGTSLFLYVLTRLEQLGLSTLSVNTG